MSRLTLHLALHDLLGILFPPRCPVCDRILSRNHRIHSRCRSLLYPVEEPLCVKCGRPVIADRMEYCPQCSRRLPSFTQGKSVYLYSGMIKKTMYRFKYSNRREYALFFAEEAVHRYAEWVAHSKVECILPVPMYPRKQRARGYNQAAVFARELSLLTGIPCRTDLLRRVENTKALKVFDADMRRKELAHAFAASACGYRSVLLVDDIYTTGSTMEAVTEALHAVGVEQVYVLTVAVAAGW